jgi:hypothetical protein
MHSALGKQGQPSELRRSGIESIPKAGDCHLRGIRGLSSRSASAVGGIEAEWKTQPHRLSS